MPPSDDNSIALFHDGDSQSPEVREFHAMRVGQICQLMRKHFSAERGLRILDAGCGRGQLTHHLRSFGHYALGIDPDESAIQVASRGGSFFEHSELAAYRATRFFDVVLCMGRTETWREALSALAMSASADSLLIISGRFDPEQRPSEYQAVLSPLDFELVEATSLNLGTELSPLWVFRRSPA